MQPNSHTGRYQIPVFREVGCHFTRLCSLLEQVLWAAGSRRRPTWEREKLGERRERPPRETPAGSGRMRARGAPIRCDAVRLVPHWPPLLAPFAAVAAVVLIAVHGGFLFAGEPAKS